MLNYYLANQLVENVQQLRQQGQTHKMYEQMEPVYGIAEKKAAETSADLNVPV